MLRMANKHMHYAISPFYFGVTTYCEALILLMFIPSVYNFQHYTLYGVALMTLSGVANYIAQTLRSAALKFEDASVISPFSYLQVIYLFILDLLVFNYSFKSTEILGGIIITLCLLGPEIHAILTRIKFTKNQPNFQNV